MLIADPSGILRWPRTRAAPGRRPRTATSSSHVETPAPRTKPEEPHTCLHCVPIMYTLREGGREGGGGRERNRVDIPRMATSAALSPSGTRRAPGVATAAAVRSRACCGTARGLQRFSRSEGSCGPKPQNRRCGLEAVDIADRLEEGSRSRMDGRCRKTLLVESRAKCGGRGARRRAGRDGSFKPMFRGPF